MENGSVAIVTGASQGIGRATTSGLARDFSAVILEARNEEELEKTVASVSATGAEPLVCALDLRGPPLSSIFDPSHPVQRARMLVRWKCGQKLSMVRTPRRRK